MLAQKGLRLGQNLETDASRPPLGRALPVVPAAVAGNVPAEVLSQEGRLTWNCPSAAARRLQRLNINLLGELASRTEDELLGCKNFGQTSLNEIKQQLATFGMGLRKLEE